MFVGHYAVGFGLKKHRSDIPLWLLFLSVQLVDILAFALVLMGIEGIKYNPSPNPFLRTVIDYVPYSHSLLSNVILAVLVLAVFWKVKGRAWGVTLSVAVLSHWFLDVLVHLPNMPLVHNSYKLGLGLWKFSWVAFMLELGVFIFVGFLFLRGHTRKKSTAVMIGLLSLGFVGMFLAPEKEATAVAASVMSLTLYAVFTTMAVLCDRKVRNQEPEVPNTLLQ